MLISIPLVLLPKWNFIGKVEALTCYIFIWEQMLDNKLVIAFDLWIQISFLMFRICICLILVGFTGAKEACLWSSPTDIIRRFWQLHTAYISVSASHFYIICCWVLPQVNPHSFCNEPSSSIMYLTVVINQKETNCIRSRYPTYNNYFLYLLNVVINCVLRYMQAVASEIILKNVDPTKVINFLSKHSFSAVSFYSKL